MLKLALIPLAFTMLSARTVADEPHPLFEDQFKGKLGDGWSWLREDKDSWRIKDKALEIRVQPGVAQNVKNALVRKAPDRTKSKYLVEVTVTFTRKTTQQYEQAGITWYHQKKPIFKLVHEHIDGKVWVIPGKKPAPHKTVQLRLIVDGNKLQALYREGPKGEFKLAGTKTLPDPGDDQISLQCYNGPPDSEHWIRFEDFRIRRLKK